MNEQDLVPYTCTPLRGERLLVLAPHPDDEVIGCGGLVALHAREGRRVQVVIASDGVAAEPTVDETAYREMREAESALGLQALGVERDPVFLRFPDRELATHQPGLRDAIRGIILSERPDLILAPSPVEIHPDHVALARALFDVVHEDDDVRGILAVTSVAFYEVSQPFQPNALVDVTSVLDVKREAISRHASQMRLRDYAGYHLGLGRYRALTLPAEVEAAEGYRVVSAGALRALTWAALCASVSPRVESRAAEAPDAIPVTVVVRTRNRENWLREAVASVLANDHPARVIVVNDGGASPAGRLAEISPDIVVVDHAESRGRSAAMNAGVERAETEWIAFLDDDDLYYPEHLSTLAAAASTGTARAYYTDAVFARMRRSDDGGWIAESKTRVFQQEFDANLLLIDNYIPLPTLLVRRADFLAAGGFDPSIDMFEDWDFLIRLSALGPLQRVPRVTCEVRQFPSSGSPVLAAPEGSTAYLDSKRLVWEKHRDRLTFEAFEAQKRRMVAHFTRALELEGRARRIESDLDRLEREKRQLIEEIQREHQSALAAHRETDATRQALAAAEERVAALEAARVDVQRQLDETELDRQARNGECESLRALLDDHRTAVADQTATITSLHDQLGQLNGLLERMRSTKAWKLHLMLEKMKGHG
jgi:LmbE family N-acetylglucosaminyl deacetylase